MFGGKMKAVTFSYDGHSFNIQENLLRFNPTVHQSEVDKMFELGKQFVELQTEAPKIFYIWGHSYEFDAGDLWEKFEKFCQFICGRNNIYYGTNKQVLLI